MATSVRSSYRPHRPHLMWTTPLATTQDPIQAAIEQLLGEKMEREEMERTASKRHTVIQWADPIATVADDKQKELHVRCTDKDHHVAWSDPIATIVDTGKPVQRRTEVFECEKVLRSKKKTVNGKVVWTGWNATIVGFGTRSLSPALYQCPDTKTALAMAWPPTNFGSSPWMGDEWDVEATAAMGSGVEEVDVEAEGRVGRLIRKWMHELACCDLDEQPLKGEEQLLLRKESGAGLKRRAYRPAPWYAYGLACGVGMLMLGVMLWVFQGRLLWQGT